MMWAILIALSLLAAALLAFALWPWASKRQPQLVYRGLVAVLAAAVLAGPSIAYRLSQPAPATAPVDLSAFPLPGDGAAGTFVWDGPLAAGATDGTDAAGSPHQADMSLDVMTSRLAEKLKGQPDNRDGWVLLGRSYAALGNIDSAKSVFAELVKKWPEDVEVKIAYGEVLMTAANGVVTPQARELFAAAAAAAPSHPRAQYDLALADAQAGRHQAAYDRWLALLKGAPADALWRQEVAARVRDSAAKLGIKAPDIAAAPAPAAP